MQITVKGKNIEVTEPLQQYAEKKVEKLSKYFHNLKGAVVTQSTQRNWHTVEVTLDGDGKLLRGEERTDNMYASIDAVVEKLEKQLKRFKGKLIHRAHEEHPKDDITVADVEEVAGAEEEQAPSIVRTKRFPMKPMTAEEATLEMEMLNHDFFVFRNGDTDEINVVYKRQDGNYGLIEPEV